MFKSNDCVILKKPIPKYPYETGTIAVVERINGKDGYRFVLFEGEGHLHERLDYIDMTNEEASDYFNRLEDASVSPESSSKYLDSIGFRKVGKYNAYVYFFDIGKLTAFINPTSFTLVSDNQATGMNHIIKIRKIKSMSGVIRLVHRRIKSFSCRLL